MILDPNAPNVVSGYKPDCPLCLGNESYLPGNPALQYGSGGLVWLRDIEDQKHRSGEITDIICNPLSHDHDNFNGGRTLSLPNDVIKDSLYEVMIGANERFRELSSSPDISSLVLSKRRGPNQCYEHPTWEIRGTERVPPALAREILFARDYFEETKRCIFDDVAQREWELFEEGLWTGQPYGRILAYGGKGRVIAFQPEHPITPFETYVMPFTREEEYGSDYMFATSEDISLVSGVVADVVNGLEKSLGASYLYSNPGFHIVLHNRPTRGKLREGTEKAYRWYMRIVPHLSAGDAEKILRENNNIPLVINGIGATSAIIRQGIEELEEERAA